MSWHRSKSKRVPESFVVDDGVPPVSDWGPQGIVGRIGKGPLHGEYVRVDPLRERSEGSGPIVGYVLDLPEGHLFDADGVHLMDDGVIDDIRPPGEGGFIDLLTAALDIEWFTDPAVVTREWSRRS
jgi:hypothetical protein